MPAGTAADAATASIAAVLPVNSGRSRTAIRSPSDVRYTLTPTPVTQYKRPRLSSRARFWRLPLDPSSRPPYVGRPVSPLVRFFRSYHANVLFPNRTNNLSLRSSRTMSWA